MRIVTLAKAAYPKPTKRDRPNRRRKLARKKADRAWQDQVVEAARVDTEHGPLFRCGRCKRLFGRELVCGHHVETKGSAPEKRHDPRNGLAVCFACHTLIHLGHPEAL